MNLKTRFQAVLILFMVLGLIVSSQVLAQGRQTPPPEYKELVAAYEIKDASARIKEFERIKAAYPNSQFTEGIDGGIAEAKIELAVTLESVLSLQNDFMAKGRGPARLQNPGEAADQILRHPKLGTFDKAAVLTVILKYREEALEAKLKALPFRPEAFKAPADWKGKAVLAELFTGSECPPCVGADLGFDGLVESVPAKYLAILVYHLPIPRPDPMMNPATKTRQEVYGVNSTPTVFFDGANKMVGGGNRGLAEGKFAEYKAAVEPLLSAAPEVSLKVRASLAGDAVKAAYEFDRVVPGAEYHLVLVQAEQEHKGSNGLVSHKMVVRDLVTVDPAAPKTATFDLAASEKATDAYLTEFEKTYTRVPNFKWAVRRNAIPRQGLKVVFFVQDKATRKVLNAVVTDVK